MVINEGPLLWALQRSWWRLSPYEADPKDPKWRRQESAADTVCCPVKIHMSRIKRVWFQEHEGGGGTYAIYIKKQDVEGGLGKPRNEGTGVGLQHVADACGWDCAGIQ